MRSPRLCWAFFTQPVIYNRGVRKSNDFKYPWEPFPCPAEWSSFSSPAGPLPTGHCPWIQEGFTSCSYAVEMWFAWFALSKDLCGPSNKTSVLSYIIFLISSFIHLLVFSQQIFIEGLLCTDIILVPRIHEWTDQEKISCAHMFYLCNRWLVCMDLKRI